MKGCCGPRVALSKHLSDDYAANLLEKTDRTLFMMCVQNRNSDGPRDFGRGLKFIKSMWVLRILLTFHSCGSEITVSGI